MMKRLSSPGSNMLLVGAAIVAGWWAWGWQGLVLAITLIVFWMLLQFRRATRALEMAARRPKGEVDSVVMLQSRLEPGQQMAEVLALTGSLGEQQGGRDDWRWHDAAGNEIELSFRRGVLVRWAVARAEAAEDEALGAASSDVMPTEAARTDQPSAGPATDLNRPAGS